MNVAHFIAILLLVPTASSGQSVGQDPLDFKENLREEATISGALFAGLQRIDGHFNANGNVVYVEAPPDWAGDVVCLRVTTSNGLYDSEASYQIPEGATILPLSFPTEHARYLTDRPPGGVAALISRGQCSARSAESAIIRWSAETDTPVVLFLNAFRADRVYVYLDTDPIPVECVPLQGDVRTAYDVQCIIEVLSRPGPITLEILSITNGQPSDPTILTFFQMATR
jgi:hypothetical protein